MHSTATDPLPTALHTTEREGERETTAIGYDLYCLAARWTVHAKNESCRILPYLNNLCFHVSDINECQQEDKGGCEQQCDNLDGGYSCSCEHGFLLFTVNGTGGKILPSGETGLRPGDMLRLNHSCVRK